MIKKKIFKRDISPNEKIYIASQEVYTTFAIQFIIDFDGDLDKVKFEEAVKKAGDFCPGARIMLKGNQWVDTQVTTPIFYRKDDFDGYDFSKLDIFKKKIDVKKNPATEIYVLPSANKIIFRVFHGAMDGQGALIWVKNIFRALREEDLVEAKSEETDLSFAKLVNGKKIDNELKFNKILFKNRRKLGNYQIYWKRLSIEGRFLGVVGKIAKALTESFQEEHNKFLIPVDMRRYNKNIISTGNLTLPIFIETHKGETWKDINAKLIDSLKNAKELNLRNADFGCLTKLPRKVLRNSIRLLTFYQDFIQKYMIGGIISFLGDIQLESFSFDDFKAKAFYAMPVQQPLSPLSIVIVQTDEKTEILVSCYEDIIKEKECDEILKKIEDTLMGKEIYNKLNNTYKNFSDSKNIIDLFKKEEKKNPNAIAVSWKGKELTYKELDEKSDTLANFMKERGLKKGNQIALFLRRNIDLFICIFASIKIGAIYIPIDIDYDKNRIKGILNDENLDLIFSSKDTYDRIAELTKKEIINIDLFKFSNWIKFDYYDINEDDIVYKIYTSGSTGNPKGVQISHKSLVNYLLWAKDTYSTNKTSRFPLFTSIGVDLTVTSIFLPLISGGSVEVFDENTNHITLRKIIEDNKIDCIKLTPTHLKLIAHLDLKGKNKKLLIVGGEKFDTKLAIMMQEKLSKNCKIINEYGPTEATVGCIYHIFDPQNDINDNTVPIGVPIYNTEILLLDKKMKLVEPGEIGEIYILGECLATGYYKNEKLNTEKFIYVEGKKAYKTGDLGKITKRNKYIYLGRKDDQIKLYGHRVETIEIEGVLNRYGGINTSIIKPLEQNKNYLVAYYMADRKIDSTKLKEYLRGKLPIYMIPKFFMEMDEIPLGISGKIDRSRLPKVHNDMMIPTTDANHFNEIEDEIVRIWSLVLEIDDKSIGHKDEFYDLGGDSFGLIRMVFEITNRLLKAEDEEAFMDQIKDIYGNMTVGNIAKIIYEIRENKSLSIE
ncbi:non-ribosomal peptide synthetase [Crassaminicella profunda]|uniref:non-ribosomal peptide synthetase n=1 Tax=Crassaminicella profunda TaxID=1286698 RepID=UPI001CA64773|nr:non-ribosomal peptide synthetase [Crassaminicella profunda]QZY57306.1 non-ribosomal peptide synthetase [Crassaminicella profunda]